MHPRRMAGLIALAIAARVAYWMVTRDYAPDSDALDYQVIAENFARGDGIANNFPQLEMHATAFRPPAFPMLLGGLFRVFGASVGLARLTNLVIGVIVVLLVERLVTRVGGPAAGLAAAVLVAIYPPLVINDITVLAESLSLLLLVLIVLALSSGRWALAGVETGLLVLTRNSAQLFVVVIAVLILRWLGWKRALGYASLAVLVVVPWVVRNQLQLGGAVITTSNGFNLAATYSDEAHATGDFVDAVFDPRFSDVRLLQFDEIAWDRALRKRGLDGLRRHPEDVLKVSGRNSLKYFELRPSENEAPERLDGRNITVRNLSLPLFYVVTGAGLYGLWRAREHQTAVLVALAAAYFSLVSILSIAPPRLRAPFDLACCIGAGLLFGQLVGSAGAGPRCSSSASSA